MLFTGDMPVDVLYGGVGLTFTLPTNSERKESEHLLRCLRIPG